MHDQHHELPMSQEQITTTPVTPGASCTGSDAPGIPAPQGAGNARHQGAPGEQAAAEDGPQQGGDRPADKPARKRQRPHQPKHRKRLHQPSCRMNDAELARFTAAAEACEMSNAAFLAYAVDKAARDLTRTAAEIAAERQVIDELFAARRHLGRIHGLFNQIVKALNSGADVPHLDAAAQQVAGAAARMEDAADALLAHRDSAADDGGAA